MPVDMGDKIVKLQVGVDGEPQVIGAGVDVVELEGAVLDNSGAHDLLTAAQQLLKSGKIPGCGNDEHLPDPRKIRVERG